LKNYLIAFLLCTTALFALPARPQTSTTNLIMGAHWDDGTTVQGTVTLGKQNASGPDTVIATQTLSAGWTSVSTSMGAASMYDITVLSATNTQLIKFPITTALINPGNLQRAEIDLVFRKADNSVKSANISVSMAF
jgi:hypothetical protein